MSEEPREIRFFSTEEIIAFHDIALEYGEGTPGLRDRGGLDSAVHNPWNRYNYTGCGIHEIAAAYASALAQSQAFLDGNKRVGVIAAITFLEVHGYIIEDAMPIYAELIGIAEGTATIESLRDRLVEISKAETTDQRQS